MDAQITVPANVGKISGNNVTPPPKNPKEDWHERLSKLMLMLQKHS